MRRLGVFVAATSVLALVPGCAERSARSATSLAPSEEGGGLPSPSVGREVAERQCARCHAIDLADASTVADAPPLRDLYKRYAIEDLRGAFVQGIEVAHTRMPTFRLSQRDVDNLIAYLRSQDPCAQPSSNREALARCFEPL